MIKFQEWMLSTGAGTVLARQHDDMSRVLQIEGDFPEGYDWSLLVKCGEAMNIIALFPNETGVGTVLTADQLAMSGYYQIQLRGWKGEEIQHTNVITIYIPASMTGNGKWPEIPSEFTQLEQRMLEQSRQAEETLEQLSEQAEQKLREKGEQAAENFEEITRQAADEMREILDHPPVPGRNGCWQIWNAEENRYEESGIPTEIAQANWEQNGDTAPDYVKGRTHWTENVVTEIVPERTLVFDGSDNELVILANKGGDVFPHEPFEYGKSYEVVWNNVSYTCVLVEYMSFGHLGNLSLTDSEFEDTGEPFLVSILKDVSSGEQTTIRKKTTDAETVVIRIGAIENVCHKLDNKYLNLDWLPTVTKEYVEYIPEYATNTHTNVNIFHNVPELIAGNTYRVIFDGVEYVREAKDYAPRVDHGVCIGIGNARCCFPESDSEDTGEPFFFLEEYEFSEGRFGVILYVAEWLNEEHIVSVEAEAEVPNKLPAEFLPSGMPYVEENVLLKERYTMGITHPVFGQMWASYKNVPDLKVGETYTVTYNGTPYECVCQTAPVGLVGDENAVAMGNFSAVGGEDTGEPFGMLLSYAYQEVDIIDLVDSPEVRVKISVTNVHKLDNRCLPDTPLFDLAEFGLSDHELGMVSVADDVDTSKLLVALAAGSVKMKFSVADPGGSVTVSAEFNPVQLEQNGVTSYMCWLPYVSGDKYIVSIMVSNRTIQISSSLLTAA